MDKKFLAEHLDRFCATNAELIKTPIKGIMLRFHGLANVVNLTTDMTYAPMVAEGGILYIYPFYNPWAWMNTTAVNFVDAIIDIFIEKYNLPENIPVGLFGGSMGGYSVFLFALRSRHNICCAAANCPACDMSYEVHCTANSICKTYYESAQDECEDFEQYIHENSPIEIVDKLPKIPYRIAIGMKDPTLAPDRHGLAMCEAMRKAGLDIDEARYPNVGHCNFGPDGLKDEYKWAIEKVLAAK